MKLHADIGIVCACREGRGKIDNARSVVHFVLNSAVRVQRKRGLTRSASGIADIRQGYLGEVRLKDRELTLDIDVIHRKGKTLSPAASMFVKFLKECCDPADLARTADMVGERGKTKVSVKISPEDKKHLRLVGNK